MKCPRGETTMEFRPDPHISLQNSFPTVPTLLHSSGSNFRYNSFHRETDMVKVFKIEEKIAGGSKMILRWEPRVQAHPALSFLTCKMGASACLILWLSEAAVWEPHWCCLWCLPWWRKDNQHASGQYFEGCVTYPGPSLLPQIQTELVWKQMKHRLARMII